MFKLKSLEMAYKKYINLKHDFQQYRLTWISQQFEIFPFRVWSYMYAYIYAETSLSLQRLRICLMNEDRIYISCAQWKTSSDTAWFNYGYEQQR